MKTRSVILFIISFCSICIITGQDVFLSFGATEYVDDSVPIIYESTSSISLFSIEFSGIDYIDGFSGGIGENIGFVCNPILSNTVTCYSLLGDLIPPGNDTLVNISFNSIESNDICISSVTISDQNAESLEVEIGPCIYSGLCETPGDLNEDGVLNVMDIVLVLNCINLFEPPPCDSSEHCPGIMDINEDGDMNILDIVLMINIILEIS